MWFSTRTGLYGFIFVSLFFLKGVFDKKREEIELKKEKNKQKKKKT